MSRALWAIVLGLGAGALFGAQPRTDPLAGPGSEFSLDGIWDAGIDRHYDRRLQVPGLAGLATEPSPGALWYRRTVRLPRGNWTTAVLELHGARFAPRIYVDGQEVSASEGGMAPTVHVLRGRGVVPGGTIRLEVALESMADLDPKDASMVPEPDRWRSDVSSGLWDGVRVHVSGSERIVRITPWTDFQGDSVAVHWETAGSVGSRSTMEVSVVNRGGRALARSPVVSAASGTATIALHNACQPWSPDHPSLYRLRLVLRDGPEKEDSREVSWGFRDFRTKGLGFVLNGDPIQLRGASVVWHRWLRDPEAREIAFDPGWFEKNMVLRLKSYGANFLRFHLGLPPESFLDLCDRDGLLVQMEWSFFHGIKASPESLRTQWREWLDVGMRHPSVVLIHPWNETEGPELKAAWAALGDLLPHYPPLVLANRDTIHIHKYWWSLFENLGLYYDSASQFDRPIVVDEFGGNYIDRQGNAGTYPPARESFLRFLGRDPTPAVRLQFQAEANARVAEYWRRLGAAGIAPFCAIASPEDGNDWFLGDLRNPAPKPVWDALAATYSPVSASIEVWDRDYLPGQRITLPLYLFNETGQPRRVPVNFRIVSESESKIVTSADLSRIVPAHGTIRLEERAQVPGNEGDWRFEAEVRGAVPGVAHRVISSWRFRTLLPRAPAGLSGVKVGIFPDEKELLALARQNGLAAVSPDDPSAEVLLSSRRTWEKAIGSPAVRDLWKAAVDRGESLVLLDLGPRDLGQGYKKGDLGSLQGAPKLLVEHAETFDLFGGARLTFRTVAEPESHLHPAPNDASLWAGMPEQSTWLWNGLRGGLIVPAEDMEVTGLSPAAFQALWASRGASEALMKGPKPYYAYQLQGFYAFSALGGDPATMASLKTKVKVLAADAPALANRINPDAPIAMTELTGALRGNPEGTVEGLEPLASCGKNLTRIPIVEISFGPGKGRVILSEALTAGRLARGASEPGLYGIRYDPAAERFVLNMLARVAGRGVGHHDSIGGRVTTVPNTSGRPRFGSAR